MEIVDLIAEGDTVVGRFHRIPEVYFFTLHHAKITHAWGLEDTHRRLRQLGLR